MAFTTEEKEQINAQALPAKDRPSYFSSIARDERQITEEFENFLILQNQTQKQSSLDWIGKALDIEADNEDRDAILTTYLGIRATDASERVTELDEKLEDFNTFVTSLLRKEGEQGSDPSRFANVEELNIFVQSLQKPLSKITIQRDQAFHEQNMVGLLGRRLEQEQTDENSRQEIESWQPVISTYAGQSG
jgi:hypothetical protein